MIAAAIRLSSWICTDASVGNGTCRLSYRRVAEAVPALTTTPWSGPGSVRHDRAPPDHGVGPFPSNPRTDHARSFRCDPRATSRPSVNGSSPSRASDPVEQVGLLRLVFLRADRA